LSAACELGGADSCHVRVHYDGLFQPVRDGANIRVTLPHGWDGMLALETEDNLAEACYPDRGDVYVDGLAGQLEVRLDSGRVQIRLDETYAHYPGCPDNDSCVAAGFSIDCGCTEFGRVSVEARSGRAAEILVDVPPDNYYTAVLDNADTLLALGCVVDIDCDSFADCDLQPSSDSTRQAILNYPGPPTIVGLGIRVELHSGACSMIEHADEPDDYFEAPSSEVRGNLRLCSGCWDD
jgi:hypothetical protein